MQLQGRWNPRSLETGVDYTWSTLRGNDDGENASGPVVNADPTMFYPEYLHYPRFSPIGYLQGDERNRVRAWIATNIGRVTLSLLQTYDSGQPFSAVGPINVTRYAGAPSGLSYNAAPNGLYYFSDRGAFRTDDVRSTDLGLRYSRSAFGRAELFAKADLLNVFNRGSVADPLRVGTTVTTAATSSSFQPFNPFTEKPIQCPAGSAAQVCRDIGAHYQLASNFGQPLNDLAYQTPRTYRFSLGVRF